MYSSIDLRFISDNSLREIISRDINELNLCLKNDLSKSALILSGSIIEAILVDYFLAFPPSKGKTADEIKKASLANLIDWAADSNERIISEETKNIATVIRGYRNLIHPGVEYRNQITITSNKANVAGNLVLMVIDEVSTNYMAKLGYTSELALKKVESDVNSSLLFDHMINTMSSIERIKLYRTIPQLKYYDSDLVLGGYDKQSLTTYTNLHLKLKALIPIETRRTEALKLYRNLNLGSTEEIFISLCFFACDLDIIEEEKQNTIVKYILSLLMNAECSTIRDLDSYGVFSSIGKFLNSEEGILTIKKVIYKRAQMDSDEEVVLEAIASILRDIDYERSMALVDELQRSEQYPKFVNWGEWLLNQIEIPF